MVYYGATWKMEHPDRHRVVRLIDGATLEHSDDNHVVLDELDEALLAKGRKRTRSTSTIISHCCTRIIISYHIISYHSVTGMNQTAGWSRPLTDRSRARLEFDLQFNLEFSRLGHQKLNYTGASEWPSTVRYSTARYSTGKERTGQDSNR